MLFKLEWMQQITWAHWSLRHTKPAGFSRETAVTHPGNPLVSTSERTLCCSHHTPHISHLIPRSSWNTPATRFVNVPHNGSLNLNCQHSLECNKIVFSAHRNFDTKWSLHWMRSHSKTSMNDVNWLGLINLLWNIMEVNSCTKLQISAVEIKMWLKRDLSTSALNW